MNRLAGRAGLVATSIAMVALAACSNKSPSADPSLKADLAAAAGSSNATVGGDIQLAPSAARSQTVVSAIEGGPTSAPARASVKHTPKPKPRPNPQATVAQTAPAAAPRPEVTQPDVSQPTEAPAPSPAPVTRPQPMPAQQPQRQQRGTYTTEAEIFKKMPWIRP